MSHRQSITVQSEEFNRSDLPRGKWYNLPTVIVGGKKVSPEAAVKWAGKKKIRLGKAFNNVEVAEQTEGLRSEASMSPRFHLGDRPNNASSAIAELEKRSRRKEPVHCDVCDKNLKALKAFKDGGKKRLRK